MIIIVGLGVLGTRVLARLTEYEKLLLIDYDIVEEKNIRRQYPAVAVGMKKVDAARKYIRPSAQILHKHLDWSTVGVLHDAEIVIDCTDNMLARYVINDYCVKHGIPWIHAGLSDTLATVATIVPGGPCFQCIYPRGMGETCGPALDLRVADHTADVIVQELKRMHTNPAARFIRVMAESSSSLAMRKRPDCPTCSGSYRYLEPHDYYLTWCMSANCMSAKPVHARHHDLGPHEDTVVDGMPVTIFANGEIHFHKFANDDLLHTIAQHIYKKRFPHGLEGNEHKPTPRG